MASHTINGQVWPSGTTVSVYSASAQPAGGDGTPMGQPLASAVVAGASVTFDDPDLFENVRYVAYASGVSRRFLIPQLEPSPTQSIRTRMDRLEGDTLPALNELTARIVTLSAPIGVPSLDRLSIQAAIDAADVGDKVTLHPNSTYVVDSAGTSTTPTHGATPYRYCLMGKSGVTLELNGSTIQLAAGVDASVFRGPTAGGTDVGLVGGTVDGGGNTLTDTGGYAVWFDTITGLTLDVEVINSSHGAVVLEACSKVEAPRIVVDTCDGVGLGVGNLSGLVTDSWFGLVDVRNITAWAENPTNYPGNPVVGSAVDTHMDTVRVRNCTAGVKVDEGSVDWTFGIVDGDTNSTTNSGLKFQGTGTGTPLRCHAEHVHMRAQNGEGLRMSLCVDCSVGTYIGDGNGIAGSTGDVTIAGTRDSVQSIRSTEAGSDGVAIGTAVNYRLGKVRVRNCGNTGGAATKYGISFAASSGVIDELIAVDDQGTPTMSRGVNVSSTSAICRIGYCEVQGETFFPVLIGASQVIIDDLRTHPTDPLMGEVLLTAAATSTAIANGNVIQNAGDEPFVDIIPINASAAALAAGATGIRATFAVGTLTLVHGAAAGTERFVWRLHGYGHHATSSA